MMLDIANLIVWGILCRNSIKSHFMTCDFMFFTVINYSWRFSKLSCSHILCRNLRLRYNVLDWRFAYDISTQSFNPYEMLPIPLIYEMMSIIFGVRTYFENPISHISTFMHYLVDIYLNVTLTLWIVNKITHRDNEIVSVKEDNSVNKPYA